MSYCEPKDVLRIIETPMIDDDVQELINEADAEINVDCGTQTVGDLYIRKLSMLITALMIRTKDPSSVSIGEYSESNSKILDLWSQKIKEIKKKIISGARFEDISTYEVPNLQDRFS